MKSSLKNKMQVVMLEITVTFLCVYFIYHSNNLFIIAFKDIFMDT